MSTAEAIRDLITTALPGWSFQFGRWVDGGPAESYAVLKPAGGPLAELVRKPQFTLSLIGALGTAITAVAALADAVVELLRADSGPLVFLQPGEPVFMATNDGRPVFEIAISAITV